jgi:hypothetical protein
MNRIPFANRRETGQALAREVRRLALRDAVVLALPRGGVPVGYEVARSRLNARRLPRSRKQGGISGEPRNLLVAGSSPAHSSKLHERVPQWRTRLSSKAARKSDGSARR